MEERIYLINLYDCYSKMLSPKQRQYFEEYYFNNFSLGEISTSFNVTRNAVFKNVKETCNKLKEYEDKVGLYKMTLEIKKVLLEVDSTTRKKIEDILAI